MAISSGDLAKMRAGNQLVKPHLNVTPQVTIATMQVNQSSYSWPIAQVTVDNVSMNGGLAFADIPIGSMVWIGTTAGAHDVAVTTTRKSPSGTTLFIAGMGPGDPGYAQRTHTMLADDHYITVLAVKPLYSMFSRIYSNTFYKRYDVGYTDEGSDPAPVCNIGPWRRLELTAASVSATFTNAAITDVKPASFAWGSKTISSYAWTTRNSSYALNTGCSFDGGTDDTEGVTITWDTAGFYIVYCTITDSGGKTHTAETYVWVVDGTNESDLSGWYIDQDKQDLDGRQITIGMNGDTAESVVFPGAGFLYTEEQTYNGDTVTAGATVTTFAGYVKEEKATREIKHGKTMFEIVSPSLVLKDVPMASQYVQEVTSPANWTQVTSDLSHPSGVAWYLLQHHCPQMLQVVDFAPLVDPNGGAMDTANRDKTWLFQGKSLWDQLKEILPHQINVGCDSQGALYLRHDPQIMPSYDRDYVDERMTWGASDIREELEYSKIIRLPVGIVDGYAFSYDGSNVTPYWARSPGDTQAQGKTTNTVNGMVVSASNAQVDLNYITGHLFAKANSPTPQIILKAMRNLDTADPARMVWHKLNVAATYDPRGVGWSNMRILPIKVNRKWEQLVNKTWRKRIEITMQPETSGNAAMTKEVPVASDTGWNQWGDWFNPFEWTDFLDTVVPDMPPTVGDTEPNIAGINADGYLYTTGDFTTTNALGGPTWSQADMGLTGTPKIFVVDAFSGSYLGTGTQVNGWVATTYGIYRITDIFGTPAATLQHTFLAVADAVNMDFSFGSEGWGVCVVHYPTGYYGMPGTYCTYTTNSGATWSAETAITTHYSTTATTGAHNQIGLYVSSKTAGYAVTYAYTATGTNNSTNPSPYYTTNYGASWSIGGNTISPYSQGGLAVTLHVPYDDNDAEAISYNNDDYWYFGHGYNLYKYDGGGSFPNSDNYGPYHSRWGIDSCTTNRQYMVMTGINLNGTPHGRLYVSTNAGSSWTTKVSSYGANWPPRVAMSGNNQNAFYVFGTDIMQYTSDLGTTLDSRWGNLSVYSPGEFIGICGKG